jgi:hypothetical protein
MNKKSKKSVCAASSLELDVLKPDFAELIDLADSRMRVKKVDYYKNNNNVKYR